MATIIEGVDCASTISNPGAMKAAGKHFACRYLSTAGNPKNLGHAEAAGLHAAGLEVVTVFELTANRALGGSSAGVADAKSANAQARALGAPADVTIYFAVDFDMSDAEWPSVRAYFDGAVSVLGRDRVGGYGGKRLSENLRKRRVALGLRSTCKYVWQTYAWSGTPTQWVAGCQLQQYLNGQTVAGISVDLDRATTTDYGQWNKPPKPVKAKKPDHYILTYTDKFGHTAQVKTKRPKLWQHIHHFADWRGDVNVHPVHHK